MADSEQEKNKLLEENITLRKALEWYKNTYEKRSLPGIIYERVFKKLTTFFKQEKVKVNKTRSVLSGKILCTIVNHNYSQNAETLNRVLNPCFDTLIIDSGSDVPPKNSLKLENIYYSALLNKAYSIAKENKYSYLLFLCSDVIVTKNNAVKMFERLSNIDLSKIGLYAPASQGNSYPFCNRKTGDNLREVPFIEGFMFLCDIAILDTLCPINTQLNLYGWGLDLAKAFYAKANNKLCVIDDAIEVEHLAGTGYSRDIAKTEMAIWIKSLNDEKLTVFFENSLNIIIQQLPPLQT